MLLTGFNTRLVEAGYFSNSSGGLTGRGVNPPPQLGQIRFNTPSTQVLQYVHSKVHIQASVDSGGKSLSQFSQLGRSSSMIILIYLSKLVIQSR